MTKQYTFLPIRQPVLYGLFKQAQLSLWKTEQVDSLSRDKVHYNEILTEKERECIKLVLGFFAASDGIVMGNLLTRFVSEVEFSESQAFFAAQAYIEVVHSEMYSVLIDTYISDPEEKDRLFDAVANYRSIKEKADWTLDWIKSDRELWQRLIAFICVEGIFFSASFCVIYWIKDRGIMPGLSLSNDYIARDEGLHCKHGIELFKIFTAELDKNEVSQIVYKIFDEAVALESKFVEECLPEALDAGNMTQKLMKQYVKHVADVWLLEMGLDPKYNVGQPFGFMNLISVDAKVNFFESHNHVYSTGVQRMDPSDLTFE